MTERKKINEGFQPAAKGYQPTPQKPSSDGKVQGGYQPTTSESKSVQPPPKKP